MTGEQIILVMDLLITGLKLMFWFVVLLLTFRFGWWLLGLLAEEQNKRKE